MNTARFLPAGERALVVEFGDEIDPEINGQVRALTAALTAQPLAGVVDVVPSYRSLLVEFDPLTLNPEELERQIQELLTSLSELNLPAPQVTVVPVCYGREYGPDLPFVADHTGLNPEEIISIHSGTDYLIYVIGFTPGYCYLGGMDERLTTPRLKIPRTKVPAGSVGIGNKQTGIYSITSPGGWQIIGRTPLKLYDPYGVSPFLLTAGNYVRFRPVDKEEYDEIAAQVAAGTYQPEVRSLTDGGRGDGAGI
ncbi:MAG: 5-oxoprolinase subunit PxpB [Firmicutes bacterium]|jgi:inhibitor of KinA|nr:5-oxoprolinase subunit PxpB [Bacillota bacterium]